jgi:hypothetical protein
MYTHVQQHLTCTSRARHAGSARCLSPRAVAVVAAHRAVGATVASRTHCDASAGTQKQDIVSITKCELSAPAGTQCAQVL